MSCEVFDRDLPTSTDSKATCQPCPVCRRALAVRAPRCNEPSADWICETCGAPLTGVLVPSLAATLGQRIRLAPQHFHSSRIEPIPAELRQLIEIMLIRRRLKQESHERRRNPRVPCDLDAIVVGLDDQWLPCRDPLSAVVIDLAAHGLGMMTAQCVKEDRLAIQIDCPAGHVQLLGRRAWSNYVGDFQNTGIEFVARLGRTAISHDGPIG